MSDTVVFPQTPEEFIEEYSFTDYEEAYIQCNELIEVSMVKRMLDHYYKPLADKATPKKQESKGSSVFTEDSCCPACDEYLYLKQFHYCPYCGQRLLWD